MREAAFIKQNHLKWEDFENELSGKSSDPDRLADLFIQITDDLAFAQTQYPDSKTTFYLNGLASQVHQSVYKTKKEKKGRFIKFWIEELPLINRECRRQILYSFLIFCSAALVGAVSAAHDDSFVRLILGDSYVNMTLENINNDDPMAVYKGAEESSMFLRITFNNIRVSFYAFVLGVLVPLGTPFILINNGIMLGSFQYFFFQKGLFLTSFLTIWIHGTLEISAIVIAGGAGIVMGNSILFPGTFTRLESFKQGARKGMKLVVGLIPIFITAGFLESYATRHTEYPIFIKSGIILISAAIIIYYFFIYPEIVYNRGRTEKN